MSHRSLIHRDRKFRKGPLSTMLVETEYDAVRQLGDLMSRSHIDFMVDHPLFFAGKIKQVASSD